MGETTNYPPQNITISGNSVQENSPSGTVIGVLETLDSNPLDNHTYAFQGNAKDKAEDPLFYIGNDTLYVNDTLDFETQNPIWVYITATDDGGKVLLDSLKITLLDANDAPTLLNAILDQLTREDELFEFTFDQNAFGDVDAGDELSFTASMSDESNLPTWLTFNAASRTFSGTPADLFNALEAS